MLESVRNRLRIPRLRGFIPVLAIGAIILAGACDFQVLEPWDSPRWGVSLTLPLINRTYYLADLAENDTTISTDTLTQELQIEFIGSLDTTQIDSSFLEVQLPSVATSRSISETVDGINASDLLPEDIVETVRIEIALDSLLRAAPLPLFDDVSFPTIIDVVIPQADWNERTTPGHQSRSADHHHDRRC